MSSAASVGGLISGIDTNSLLDELYQFARTPINRLEARKELLNQQSIAWSALEVRLLNFRTTASQLSSPASFDLYTVAATHSDLVSASASSAAVRGAYFFTVDALAQTHQVASQGYADTTETEVGSGTISITVGDAAPTIIDVDNFTLAELRDAINAADAGVRAAIINDGSDATPYRLLLTSQTSGLDGEMTVTPALAGGAPPSFSDLQAAQDAQITLGSGAGAITVTSGSNTISDAIQGVTLDLLGADPSTTVTVSVARDTAALQNRVLDLVETYNAVVDFLGEQFYYDPETEQTGALFANFQLQTIQQDLSAALTNAVVGLDAEFHSLSELGIRTLSTGKLSLDSTALAAAIADHLPDVIGLFAAIGETTDSAVTYLASTTDTQPSGTVGWAVDITQVARQARVTAGVAQTVALAADETLTLNGVNISLTAGMTQTNVIDAINDLKNQTGVTASATDANGEGAGSYLTLTRVPYGSAYHLGGVSTLSNQGGNDTSGLGAVSVTDESPAGESGTGTGAVGLDVEGAIGGEEATGAGQRLIAESGDPNGLQLLITADSPGSYGTALFTVGAAEAAFRVSVSATDTSDGTVALAQDYIADSLGDIDEEIARLETLVAQEQDRLRAAFVRMEQALGQFQAQSQFLASQFAQMSANSASA
jgi:flagellar hook-associated protein 2